MTLPDDIADLALRFYEVCAKHGVSVVIRQNGDRCFIMVKHAAGEINLKMEPGYFQMPQEADHISPALSVGIVDLVNDYREERARCGENIEILHNLDPGVLDRIVTAVEETETD